MMSVKDLWKLSIMKNFSVEAGESGLHKKLASVEILDFEFVTDIERVRETVFNPNSLVLSSLLFAKKNPELLMTTIKKLIELNVTAFAYKPVIFNELPEEVISYANEQGFPILRFGGDEFFEDIIIEVLDYLKEKNDAYLLGEKLKEFLQEELTAEQIDSFLLQLHQPLEKYVTIANIRMTKAGSDEGLSFDSFSKSTLVCSYNESIYIVSTNRSEQWTFAEEVKEWLVSKKIPQENVILGFSDVHLTETGLHLAVREAYFSRIFAEINQESICYYRQLYSEKLLIELYRNDREFTRSYVKEYLGVLLEEQEHKELLETATTFVLQKGNIKEVAAIQFCHENTIRYRLTKIRRFIDPLSNELVFYEHLQAAIKLYLLDTTVRSYDLEFVQKES